MKPLTTGERAELGALLPGQNPASAELLLIAARNLRDSSLYAQGSPWIERRGPQLRRELSAILARLLDAEQQAADAQREAALMRRVLAEAVALADAEVDITAGDIRHLLAAVDLSVDREAALAYDLRMAEATGGAW